MVNFSLQEAVTIGIASLFSSYRYMWVGQAKATFQMAAAVPAQKQSLRGLSSLPPDQPYGRWVQIANGRPYRKKGLCW